MPVHQINICWPNTQNEGETTKCLQKISEKIKECSKETVHQTKEGKRWQQRSCPRKEGSKEAVYVSKLKKNQELKSTVEFDIALGGVEF